MEVIVNDELMIGFCQSMRGDSPDQPDIVAAVAYAQSHPSVLTSDLFGGVLNRVIRSTATTKAKIDGIEHLIKLGASPEGADNSELPVFAAVGTGDLALARFLLRINPIPVCEASKYSPLALAIHYGNLEMVKLLVEAGMDPGKNHNGETMISRARKYGHKEIEEYLRSKCTPEQLAQVPAPGSFADVLATNFAQVTKTASHVLMGVSVHFAGNLLITEGLGCESPDGTSVEFFMARAEDAPEDWALSIVMAGVDGLRSGKAIASDIGEIVPMKGVPRCKYTHLLLLKDRQAGSYQFFRAFPIFKKEAKFAIKSGARALVERFQERGVSGEASLTRNAAV